ncbi:sensor histidine kinase [Paenibacillus sp. NPDC058071]|uniref:sensor histidine kinase n=1 Tax=Paenibacillus sp. NPDC058071 TaxID=3346326 RepID=UPI0036DB14E5
MVIKWKNRLQFGIWLMMVSFGLSGLFTGLSFGNQYVHRDYYHTAEFRREIGLFAHYLNMFELNYIPYEKAKETLTVSEREVIQYRNGLGNLTMQTNSIKDDYQFKIDEASFTENQEAAKFYIAERDNKIADYTKLFTSDEYVRAKILNEKAKELQQFYVDQERYRSDFLKYKNQFQYSFTSSMSDKVYTNRSDSDNGSAAYKMDDDRMLYKTSYSIPSEESVYWLPIPSKLEGAFLPFSGEIAVSKDLSDLSSIKKAANKYERLQMALWIYTFSGVAILIMSIIFAKKMVVLPSVVERWSPFYNKLPVDVRTVSIVLSGVIALSWLFSIRDQFVHIIDLPFNFGQSLIIETVLASLFIAAVIIQGKMTAAQFENWQQVKKECGQALTIKAGWGVMSLLSKIKNSLADAFLSKSAGTQLFALLGLLLGLGVAAGLMMGVHLDFILLYFLLLVVLVLPIIILFVNRIGHFNRIVMKMDQLAQGDFGDELKVSGKSVLAALADNINVLQQGAKSLQNEQAKSERLKTELVTNVSHDLRTPLTSIITYTELLKKDDVSKEESRAYLEIIDRKSQRLKVLIDDLFEISKMASGDVELAQDRVDLVQLLQQALAEYDTMINNSNLQFRFTSAQDSVYAMVDGKKLWRVFDNLIGNILKYSLENSRVYIQVKTSGNHAVITFKNVSKFEINGNTDELFERFKRGDSSRQTDGSGLGLAIAKSIVDLLDGRLHIEIDGDLFKVSIALKLME